jgi:hypothetical protein
MIVPLSGADVSNSMKAVLRNRDHGCASEAVTARTSFLVRSQLVRTADDLSCDHSCLSNGLHSHPNQIQDEMDPSKIHMSLA